MSKGRILVERQGETAAWIVMDNPGKLNAISLEMWAGLDAALTELLAEPALRVIILRGAGGKAFASGADISEFPDQRNSSEVSRNYEAVAGRTLEKLREAGLPTIAMIEGYCFGGGVVMALACDLRFASEDARFSIPAARVGLGYNWPVAKDLIDAVGAAAAKEMLFTARTYSAGEASAMGLINKALPPDALLSHTQQMAERIASNAPLTLRAAKVITTELLKPNSLADLALCEKLCAACIDSRDYREGYEAFLEKRKPVFRGE